MKIIVTGSAGFIGFSLCVMLLERGDSIIGIDNHNNYYDPKIKESRLQRLTKYSNYQHYRVDLSDQSSLDKIFNDFYNNKYDLILVSHGNSIGIILKYFFDLSVDAPQYLSSSTLTLPILSNSILYFMNIIRL